MYNVPGMFSHKNGHRKGAICEHVLSKSGLAPGHICDVFNPFLVEILNPITDVVYGEDLGI